MFRSLWCRVGKNIKSTSTTTINGQSYSSSSSSAAANRYILFPSQNPDVETKARVSNSMFFCSFSTSISSLSPDSAFVVSYLIKSCGLSENEAITVSKKIKFKTTAQPDSVISLFENYGFAKPHISKLITKLPLFLLSDPIKTLKPKLDFLNSKGLHGIKLGDFISRNPQFLKQSLKSQLIPSFKILQSILCTDTNVITTLKGSSWILNLSIIERLMVNLELLRCQGVPGSIILKYLILHPRSFTGDADKFKKIVGKVEEMGFNPSLATFIAAIKVLTSMSEANWKTKVDVYKKWGWSEDQIQTAFRKNPSCMIFSEKKIMAIMDLLVNVMGYNSSSIAKFPRVFNSSLEDRIIPRCSVIRILVSKGQIQEKVSLQSLSLLTDDSFLDKFVTPYEQEAPELMKVFKGQVNYQELLLK